MYRFRKLNNRYFVESIMIRHDGKESSYSCEVALDASYNNIDQDYTFELINKQEIKLNGKDPVQPVDLLMITLSASLYPIALSVSKEGEIREVVNFDKIKERWEKTCEDILSDSYSVLIDNYISLSATNMEDENSFLNALKRDSFIQFYFADNNKDSIDVACSNFPDAQETTFYSLELEKDTSSEDKHIYSYEDDQQYGKATYKYSELMDLLSANMEFSTSGTNGKCIKKVFIRSDDRSREIKKTNKLISFFVD